MEFCKNTPGFISKHQKGQSVPVEAPPDMFQPGRKATENRYDYQLVKGQYHKQIETDNELLLAFRDRAKANNTRML